MPRKSAIVSIYHRHKLLDLPNKSDYIETIWNHGNACSYSLQNILSSCLLSEDSKITRYILDSSVSIAMGYGLDGQGLIPGRSKRFVSTPQHPRGPPSLLSNGYRGPFPQGWSNQGVKPTTHLHLLLRSRMVELYFHSSVLLHGVVLN
jgi:hypothetical protein